MTLPGIPLPGTSLFAMAVSFPSAALHRILILITDMPAQIQLFNTKAKSIYSFGAQHRNIILYQPQGRLLLTAGFGNLAGGVDIWDVSTRVKVAEFR